ncbi:VgrG-related protein [Streptomyces rubellomurinus]|uniref:Type IV secretion protein Rhs n=1 Tax=Streptomyces rubellomurinus (strain ATCC 31215) TaxID=359131 RepID=A0A0F2TFF6_STRR3|nr:VgrG-related protein [Streptomyces rubellomurinus]KJS61933.1 type IV secretion protein Rhs [Streptomyces rubellomurinus]
MAGEGFANTLTVEVDGRPLAPPVAELLVSAHVDDSRRLPGLFVLRFRDPHHLVLGKTGLTIGTPVKLFARSGDDPARELLLSGEVTALEVDADATGTFTVVRGFDHSHRLLRGRRVAGYRQMTVSDIVTVVARRAGLPVGTVDATTTVLQHVAQPGITDWEFLNRLAVRTGSEVSVEDGRFHFRRPTPAAGAPDPATPVRSSPFVLELGRNLLRCNAVVTSADQVREVEVRGWDVRAKRAVVAHAPAGGSDLLSLGLTPRKVAEPFGEAAFLATDVPYAAQPEADHAARSLAADLAASFAELSAVAMGIPKLRAGSAVALTNIGAPFEGKYTVTATRHVFDPGVGYQTWITVSGRTDRSLLGLTAGGQGPRDRVAGLANATVTDTRDPEHQGRVRLAFPWLSDDYVSDWVRTAQLGGKGGGGVFGPEVGDEVLVGFEQGLIDHPYVVGGLYNGEDRPSRHDVELVDGTSGALNRRSLVSRSGHRLELLDAAAGPKGVRVATGDGKLTLHLDAKGTTIVVHSDGSVEIDAGQKVTVKAGQGVSVDAGRGALELAGDSVRVTARSGVQLDGGAGALKLQTQGQVDVSGTTVGVSGSASTEIKGGATCSISAALVKIN